MNAPALTGLPLARHSPWCGLSIRPWRKDGQWQNLSMGRIAGSSVLWWVGIPTKSNYGYDQEVNLALGENAVNLRKFTLQDAIDRISSTAELLQPGISAQNRVLSAMSGPSPFVIGATHQFTLQHLNGVVRRCELIRSAHLV